LPSNPGFDTHSFMRLLGLSSIAFSSIAFISGQFVLAIIVGGLIGCTTQPTSIGTQSWSSPIKSNVSFALENRYGDIHVRQGSLNFVGLTAATQCSSSSEDVFGLTKTGNAGLAIEILGQRCLRVDVTLHASPDLQLNLMTRGGQISARRIANPVSARSNSGDITIRSRGVTSAASKSGNVRLHAASTAWSRPHQAHTKTGAIMVSVPLIDAAFEACTRGSLWIDPALSEYEVTTQGHCTNGRHGTGDSLIRLQSNSGDLQIYIQ
jgi:hypothetical protein